MGSNYKVRALMYIAPRQPAVGRESFAAPHRAHGSLTAEEHVSENAIKLKRLFNLELIRFDTIYIEKIHNIIFN